jgi:ribonuclease HII
VKKQPLPTQLNKERETAENERLEKLMHYEREAYAAGYRVVAGVDEAGRGPLAGPIVAAACILPSAPSFYGIDDSKKLSPSERQRLFEELTQHPHVHYSVVSLSHETIDKINIHQANIQAVLQAVETLPLKPDFVLADGLKTPSYPFPHKKIVKGDSLSQSIAAASIIAKVTRDKFMDECHVEWPEYGFDQHRGYATARHLAALQKHGPCPIHRRSFRLY